MKASNQCETGILPVQKETAKMSVPRKSMSIIRTFLSLLLATLIWLPCLHFFFRPNISHWHSETGVTPAVKSLLAYHLGLWSSPESRQAEIQRMRHSNAEWDFMGRTYLVLALANLGLREPESKQQYLDIMDEIIAETIRLEEEHGIYYFLMDYARAGKFVAKPPRSLFQDGEIALMLGTRRLLEEKEEYKKPFLDRIGLMTEYMQSSPVMCGESYPNEGWMFCNLVALDTLRMAEVLDGKNYDAFIEKWLEIAKVKLTHPETGLLISNFTFEGSHGDGPEGSTIWMVAHCLQIIAPVYAQEQYDRAKKELAGSFLGFGYAREWPESWIGIMDVDSGPIIPVFDISAGSSGLAILGAAAFNDRDYLRTLLTSLRYGGFPIKKKGALRFAASNQVGDAVLLYAMVQGPLWQKIQERSGRT